MFCIEWKPEYNVHIDTIDQQHKKLVAIINELYELLTDETGVKEYISKIIDDLKEYTIYHFSTEEDLMKNSSHPNFLLL